MQQDGDANAHRHSVYCRDHWLLCSCHPAMKCSAGGTACPFHGFATKSSRSSPAVNQSPLPCRTITLTSALASPCPIASASAVYMAEVRAFFFSGRSIAMRSPSPFSSVCTSPIFFPLPPGIACASTGAGNRIVLEENQGCGDTVASAIPGLLQRPHGHEATISRLLVRGSVMCFGAGCSCGRSRWRNFAMPAGARAQQRTGLLSPGDEQRRACATFAKL